MSLRGVRFGSGVQARRDSLKEDLGILLDRGLTIPEAAKRLGIPLGTANRWAAES